MHDDLTDPARLDELWRQAVAAGWAEGGENGQRLFFVTAVCVLRLSKTPEKLFAERMKKREWRLGSSDDFSTGWQMLKNYLRGPRPRVRSGRGPEPISEVLKEVMAARGISAADQRKAI